MFEPVCVKIIDMKKYSKLAIFGFVFELIGLSIFIYPKIINNIDRAHGIWFMLLGGIFAEVSFKYFNKDINLMGKTLSKITTIIMSAVIIVMIVIWILYSLGGTI